MIETKTREFRRSQTRGGAWIMQDAWPMAMPKGAVRIDEDGRDARGLRCCEGDVVRDDAVRMPDLQIRLKRSRTGEIRDEADVPTLATPECADSGKFAQSDVTMLVAEEENRFAHAEKYTKRVQAAQ